MHADEIAIDADLVRRLLQAQFPHWAALEIRPLDAAGVDNAAFRLGDDFIMRLPRRGAGFDALRKELAWLPRLGPLLPLATPRIEGAGEPCSEFPWPWSVSRWIRGDTLSGAAVADWAAFARSLAAFVSALHGAEAADGPRAGAHNFWRGAPLGTRDSVTRDAMARLDGVIDQRRVLEAWEADSQEPAQRRGRGWIHGDLHGENVLVRDGSLCAVIDFGCLGVGDPACDYATAWRMLPAQARPVFRAALQPDDAAWRNGRAWALSISLQELDYYRTGAPTFRAIAQRTVEAVLDDRDGEWPRPWRRPG